MGSPAQERVVTGAGGDGISVLYVDPDEEAAATVRETLGERGLTVTVVTAPEEAVERLVSGRVDCAVSAYALPESDGIAVLERLRDRQPGLPVVLFTDAAGPGVASAAVAADLDGYVPRTPLSEQVAALAGTVGEVVSATVEGHAMLDRMTDAFFALDDEWRFTYVNERGHDLLCEALGEVRPMAAIEGAVIWDLFSDAVGSTFYDRYHEAMATQEPVTLEERYDPADVWYEVRAYPSPTGLSVYFRDVTERKRRERRLEQRERVLQEIHRVISRKDTSFTEKVDALLSFGQDVLGTEYAALSHVEGDDYVYQVVHDPDGTTQPGDTVPLSETNCERAIVTEETLVLEDVGEDPDLRERAGHTEDGVSCYLGAPVVVDGEVYGTFCFYDREPRTTPFDDWEVTLVELLGNWISYERERERRRAELERERNRLDDFAGVVSHDLRNPLQVAMANLAEARDRRDGEHLAAVGNALDRIDTLIDDALTLARSGEQVVDTEPVTLGRLATEAWRTAGTDAATLDVVADGTVVVDPSRFQQLVENLVRNAIEHAGPAPTVRVGVLSGGDGFYVADDGPGIPESDRERVFESGYTTSETGIGLGLGIVTEIAEVHGATVSVTESADGGARVEIRGLRVE